MISAFGITDRGMLRRNNQDAFAYELIAPDTAWGVVCDGMGGAKAGDIASRIGVEIFREQMQKRYANVKHPLNPVAQTLRTAVKEGNDGIWFVANRNEDYAGMGTTLVGVNIESPAVAVVNIGDSRAYHMGTEGLHRITRDHSVVQALVDAGNLTAQEAQHHPKKNLITRALGTNVSVEGDIFEETLQPGDWLLLCSDGLLNEMEEEELASFLRAGHSPEDTARELLHAVLERGASDNVTILLFHRAKSE